jgi:GntR family transcriptional regulator, transcriptional repressor for pyruvate dehydrogenase complex
MSTTRAQSKSPRSKQPDSRVTARLLADIKLMMSNGELPPGAKLPPERELARKFGVNRGSLRQVLKVLEIMGVITQRVGDGTYLNASAELILNEPLDFLIVLDDLTHHELFETRLIVEPELARRAAERATAADLAVLRKAIVDMENSKTLKERLDADIAFHESIFRTAGNRICHLLFRVIHRTLLSSMDRLHGIVDREQPLAAHKAIYKAIAARNPEAARRHMQLHLVGARDLYIARKPRRGIPAPHRHDSAIPDESTPAGLAQ